MKIGVVQLCSKLDPTHNLSVISGFIEEAVFKNVEMVFLPECFYSMSDGTSPTPFLVDSKKSNEHYRNIQNLAVKHGVYLVGGTAATDLNGSVVNRAYNFDPKGNDLGHYDKINLFSCELGKSEKKVIREADIYTAGKDPSVIEAGKLKIGLSICFDLRFPAMYQSYRERKANLITIPAAFTVPSGKAHWHTLVRARAIENQLFIIAAAQWGEHNSRIKTYGHSLIVDPWGEVLADGGEGEKLITALVDLDRVIEVRNSIKMDR